MFILSSVLDMCNDCVSYVKVFHDGCLPRIVWLMSSHQIFMNGLH